MGRYYGNHREWIARKIFPYVFIILFIIILIFYATENKKIPVSEPTISNELNKNRRDSN